MIEQGDVYWADMDPGNTEKSGKTRPVLVIQASDLSAAGKKSATIVPLTSRLSPSNRLRMRLSQELLPKLGKDSDVLIDEIHTVHHSRLIKKIGRLPINVLGGVLEGILFIFGNPR
jgi:mRNA-degrading endonuclease toxin of MazEF toxin-antitoxin module